MSIISPKFFRFFSQKEKHAPGESGHLPMLLLHSRARSTDPEELLLVSVD